MQNFRLFGLKATQEFAQKVADHLKVELSPHKENYFGDHEPYVRSDVNVRGTDVYVIQSIYQDEEESVADKFLKLLHFIGSLKDASAETITAVVPYLAFSRQDRKTESREPILTKYTAQLIEAVGANRLLTMDVHNLSAFQNSYRIQTDNLEAKNLIADRVAKQLAGSQKVTVLSPDSGGMGRAKRFRNALANKLGVEVGLAYLDKTHTKKAIEGENIIGDVMGRHVVVVDDMISSGSTLLECYKAVERHGGIVAAAAATHGLFVGKVNENIGAFQQLFVTDTIKPCRLNTANMAKLQVISTAKLFADAILRIHNRGGSISALLQ